MTVKLLTVQHLEFLSLKGGCPVLSESTLVKIPHCWKSHNVAQISVVSSTCANTCLTPVRHTEDDTWRLHLTLSWNSYLLCVRYNKIPQNERVPIILVLCILFM